MAGFLKAGFDRFPSEMNRIGMIVIGYGELEFEFNSCLDTILGHTETAMRVLFRARGEDARLQVGDALMRPRYRAVGLAGEYSAMYGAVKWCKNARNQYAHCHWHIASHIRFFSMDEAAKSHSESGPMMLEMREVDNALLTRQTEYFDYAHDILLYLKYEFANREARGRGGQQIDHAFRMPKSLAQPPLYNRPASQAPGQRTSGLASPP
jgi:hypothetical protein